MSEERLDDLRAAIARFAADEAPGIVAQASAEARERATSALADAMTRALVESARRELGGPVDGWVRPAPEAASATPEAEPDEVAHYVYGVVRTGSISTAEVSTGVGDSRVFAQPVFAGPFVLIATWDHGLIAYRP